MMNYLRIPDHCEARFTYDNFEIKKVLQSFLTTMIGRVSCNSAHRRDFRLLFFSRGSYCMERIDCFTVDDSQGSILLHHTFE